MVIALNMMDEAWNKGLHINVKTLEKLLACRWCPPWRLWAGHLRAVPHCGRCGAHGRLPAAAAGEQAHLRQPSALEQALNRPEIHAAFRVPHPLLLMQSRRAILISTTSWASISRNCCRNCSNCAARPQAKLPRPLEEELHADRHHRAATLFEASTRMGAPHEGRGWRYCWTNCSCIRNGV